MAVIEADQLGCLRTGAASGVAAKHLAKGGARTLGIIGCGHQAVTQVACIREALPSIEHVVAYCRTPERLAAFASAPVRRRESHRDAGSQDIVVTITSSRDPSSAASGSPAARSSSPQVRTSRIAASSTTRFSSVRRSCVATGSSRPDRVGRPDRARGGFRARLARVHELHEVVSGEIAGRQSDDDVVLFKSNGIAAWDVALGAEAVRLARERGVGQML